jgi:alpha/beta superfamily hydrolase
VFSVGYSFGADVSLTADDAQIAGWVGIASPLALLEPEQMKAGLDERPTMLLVPENDQFRAFNDAKKICEPWKATAIQEIAGADHFFMGSTHPVTERTNSFITEVVGQ